jgi:hypothetical protein
MVKYSLLLVFFLNVAHLWGQQAVELPDSTRRGSLTVKADYRIAELQERYKKQNEGKQIMGYRMQLYSGNRKGAFALKADFIRQFDLPCTVVYEAPDFKVQVGNFRTQLEAEKAMQEVWPVFKSAFVLRTKIDLPKLTIEEEVNN